MSINVSDLHPRWRYFYLSNIRQIRMMVRDGRQQAEGRALIKRVQREMADVRAAVQS